MTNAISAVRGRSHWAIGLYLAAWTFLPYTATVRLVPGSVHPATWFILAALAVSILAKPRSYARAINRRPALFILLLAVLGCTAITFRGGGSVPLFLDQIAGPTAALLILLAASIRAPASTPATINLVVIISVVLAALGLIEFASGQKLFFTEANTAYYYWYAADPRIMATTAHPLVYAATLAATIPLLARYTGFFRTVGAAAVLAAGVLLSDGRVALIVAVLGLVYLLVRSRLRFGPKFLLVVAGTIAGVIVASSIQTYGVYQRIIADGGSTIVRAEAVEWFLDSMWSFPVVGGGMGTSYTASRNAGLNSSLESFPLQAAVDFGLVPAAFLLGSLIILIVGNYRGARLIGTLPSAFAMAVMVSVFSSLSNESSAGPLLFVLVGLAAARMPDAEGEPDQPALPQRAFASTR